MSKCRQTCHRGSQHECTHGHGLFWESAAKHVAGTLQSTTPATHFVAQNDVRVLPKELRSLEKVGIDAVRLLGSEVN